MQVQGEPAFRDRVVGLIARHPAATGLSFLGLVVALSLAMYWFQPWKLFTDEVVDQPLPDFVATAGSSAPPEAVVFARGAFRSLAHHGEGSSNLLELADGKRVLRFEAFKVENGPDLFVYLSRAPADAPADAFDDDFFDLGELRGNIGNQNYAIPDTLDLSRFRSVVIWCRRFSVGFAVAPINA